MIIDFLLTLIILLFILGLLVFIHEFGHFITSKLIGVEVEEFAFGFGKKIFSKKYKDTLYRINWIPLGGYVKVLGDMDASSFRRLEGVKLDQQQVKGYEDRLGKAKVKGNSIISTIDKIKASNLPKEEKEELLSYVYNYVIPNDPDNIDRKGFWARLLVYSAGVLMNLIIAAFIFSLFLSIVNYKTSFYYLAKYPFVNANSEVVTKPVISHVYDNDLQKEGFKIDDENQGVLLLAINGTEIKSADDFKRMWNEVEGKSVKVKYLLFKDAKEREKDMVLNRVGYDINIEPSLENHIVFVDIIDGYPAQSAGVKPKDLLLKINGEDTQFDDSGKFNDYLMNNQGKTIEFELLDENGQTRKVSVTLGIKHGDNPILGASFERNGIYGVKQYALDYSDNKALAGISHTINVFGYNPVALFEIMSISVKTKDVELASQSVTSVWGTGEVLNTFVVSRDYANIINLAGLISVALAFMNILPIPLLDGGQIMFLVIEKLRGRPLSRSKQEKIAQVSFFIIVGLSVLIVLKDIWMGFIGDFIREIF